MPLAITYRSYFQIWISFLILPAFGLANNSNIKQDPIGTQVKIKLAEAAKIARINIHEAIEKTDELLKLDIAESNDSINNYIKYRHSLYLLLADKNQESKKIVSEIIPYYKINNLRKWVILTIRLGSLEIRLGEYNKAKEHLLEAIPYCDEQKLILNKGLAKVYLADIHLIKSEFGLAFQKVDQALSIFKSLDRTDWIASALTDLAYICIRAKDYQAAEEYFVQINDLKPKIKNTSFLVRPILFEGVLNFQQGNYAKAKTQLKTGVSQISDVGTFPDLPMIYQYLAKISLIDKNYDEATAYIKQAMEAAKNSNNIHFQHSVCLINIEAQKILHPEQEYLTKALDIYNWAEQNENVELIEQTSALISKRYENLGQFENALLYRNIYEKALKKAITNDKFNQISLLNEKNKFQQEAQEIALREENLQLKVGNDEKIKTILFTSITLLMGLLGSVLYLFLKLRKNNGLLANNFSDLKKAETELERKNNELQAYIESNIQLEQFAHVASHDLRSPILTINSFTSLLKNKAASKMDENELTYLNFIETNGKQMLDLVTDLLDYSKLNSQELNLADVEVKNLLEEVTNSIKPQAEEKNIVIKTDCNISSIKADEIKLKRVFQNLISNSIKFSDKAKEGFIKISCNEENTNYKFNVEDNGIGIRDHKKDLFQPYVQLNLKSKYKGTGLGLSVCKKIIEQHGGTINYSGKEGKGTTFSFSIAKHIAEHA